MGHEIWGVLKEYAGRWVAMDAAGRVMGSAAELADARRIAGARVVLFAAA